jgi:hypothetical protein
MPSFCRSYWCLHHQSPAGPEGLEGPMTSGEPPRQDVENTWPLPTPPRALDATGADLRAHPFHRPGSHGHPPLPGFLVLDAATLAIAEPLCQDVAPTPQEGAHLRCVPAPVDGGHAASHGDLHAPCRDLVAHPPRVPHGGSRLPLALSLPPLPVLDGAVNDGWRPTRAQRPPVPRRTRSWATRGGRSATRGASRARTSSVKAPPPGRRGAGHPAGRRPPHHPETCAPACAPRPTTSADAPAGCGDRVRWPRGNQAPRPCA